VLPFEFKYRASDSPLVEMVWHTHTGEELSSFTSTAEYLSEMVITKHDGKVTLSIRGPETKASFSDVPQNAEMFGIVFKLGTFMSIVPAPSLVNDALHLPEVSNHSVWLDSTMWQLPNFENADTFIAKLIREGLLAYDPLVNAVIENKPLDMSLRTIQRRFLQATGVSYKTFQQIERAKQAAALLKQGTPILDTVFEAGYYDQSHLANSLKEFLGTTPSQIYHPK
jgi:AraC-like DNA-binding protein